MPQAVGSSTTSIKAALLCTVMTYLEIVQSNILVIHPSLIHTPIVRNLRIPCAQKTSQTRNKKFSYKNYKRFSDGHPDRLPKKQTNKECQ